MTEHAVHDGFHPVTSDDPAWIETLWFPFWVPAADLTVYARVVFQPNAGSYTGSVAAWHGQDQVRFEATSSGQYAKLDDLGDLRDLTLPDGLQVRCTAPARCYQVSYEHPECSVDVRFDALTDPEYPPPDDSPGMYAGHLDQHGRVTGTLRLGDDVLRVDCGSIRDRSWGPRTVHSGLRIGNAHGTGREEAFFAYIEQDAQGGERIRGGALHRDGTSARLVEGTRHTEWDGQWPVRVRIDATDATGRTLQASGTCCNRRALVANPELYAVLNLVEWQAEGASLEGENHDIWSRSGWLDAGRSPLESES